MSIFGEVNKGVRTLSTKLREHTINCEYCRVCEGDLERKAFGVRVNLRADKLKERIRSFDEPKPVIHQAGLKYYFLPTDETFDLGMTIVLDIENCLVAAEEGVGPEINKSIDQFSYRVTNEERTV